jgi:hypothetical protein
VICFALYHFYIFFGKKIAFQNFSVIFAWANLNTARTSCVLVNRSVFLFALLHFQDFTQLLYFDPRSRIFTIGVRCESMIPEALERRKKRCASLTYPQGYQEQKGAGG